MSTTPLDANNLAVVSGTLAAPPRQRQLPSGTIVVEFDVTTRGDLGTSSVPVAWFEPTALADRLDSGDAVIVVGTVRRRFFRIAASTQSRTEVVARRVVAANRRADVRRLLAAVASTLSAADDGQ